MERNEKNHNIIINKCELLKFANKNIGSFIDEIDPIFKLLNNFSEINLLLNKNQDKFKFIYFHEEKIKKILYDNESEITIDTDKLENTLNKIFYLSLLVTHNIEIINYKYSIDYIKELDEANESNNLKLTKIIFSKIIIDLIEYFKGFEEYNESISSSIDDIKNKNIGIIKNNNNILKDFNLEVQDFINKTIEKVYIDIIKILLDGNKEYKYIYEIMNQLNLEKIDITNFIFKEISNILSNDKIIKEKRIMYKNDLLNEDKIEFYYILLKYILKNPYYIYQIPFLKDTRTFILKNIKSIKIDNKNKEKLEYLIDILTGSKYYFKHSGIEIIQNNGNNNDKDDNNKNKNKPQIGQKINENNQNLKDNSIAKHFQINESPNQQQVQNLSTSHETSKEIIIEEYIEKISIILEKTSIKYRNKEKKINYFLKKEEKEINLKDLIELKNYERYFDMNKEQFTKYDSFVKLVNFIQKIDEYIIEEYKNKNFGEISFNLKYQNFEKQNKNGIYNIVCEYEIASHNKKLNYKDENILLNGFNQGFLALLCEKMNC